MEPHDARPPRFSLWPRVLMGMVLVSAAVVLAGGIGQYVEANHGMGGTWRYLLQAAIMSGIVIPGIWLLRTRVDRRPMTTLGLGGVRESTVGAFVGIGLLAVPLLITLLFTLIFGWAEIRVHATPAILGTLAATTITTFFFEALPEELAFRGYIYRNLNSSYARWLAALLTILLFGLMPILNTAIGWYVFGLEVSLGGSNRIHPSFIVTMLIFGGFQQYLRMISGTVWTCIGFHLAFVQLNRILGPSDDTLIQFAGTATQAPFQITLISCLLLVLLGLVLYPRLSGRPIGWKEQSAL